MSVVGMLVELCEGRFNECRRTANECNYPHPEHGSRSTDGNGGCYTSEVARSHSGGDGHGKGLKRGNLLALLTHIGRFEQKPKHIGKHTKLHESALPREPQTTNNEYADEDVGPKPIYDILQHQI